jgi:hypothetical protein
MSKFLMLVVAVFMLNKTFCQVIKVDQLSSAEAKLYNQAVGFIQQNEYYPAINLLNQITNTKPNFQQAWLSLGAMCNELKKYDSSIYYYNKALNLDSINIKQYYLTYASSLAGQGNFAKALSALQVFLSNKTISETGLKKANYRKACYTLGLNLLAKQNRNPNKIIATNLGPNVNSSALEYYPTINIYNNYLIFNKRIAGKNNTLQEDFYEAYKENGIWVKCDTIKGHLNTEENEAAQTLSPDGKYIIFTICNNFKGIGGCDLYEATYDGKAWSQPKNLGPNINTEFWESAPSLSPDGRDLYFTSNKNFDNYGGKDIYVCHRQENGTWGLPENLGPVINTTGDEASPFIHFDNQTLYFLSSGHPGLGGEDLFYAKKINEKKWDSAQNLGYPINTIENEGSLNISPNGEIGYFASDRAGGYGGLDLYSFNIPKEIAPQKAIWLNATVVDSLTNLPIACSFELIDSLNNKIIKAKSNKQGSFTLTIPIGKPYYIFIKSKGYFYYTESLLISNSLDSSANKIFKLQPLQVNNNFEIKNIYFNNKAFNIDSLSTVALSQFADFLTQNNSLIIQIEGHTDNVGNKLDNLKLSNNRANAIKNYLIQQGINKDRLVSKGFGSSKPKSNVNSAAGRALNRRTEIKIIKL